MAGKLTLNVNGLVNSGRGLWESVGTTNVVTAVSDNTDSTYIKVSATESGYTGPYGQSIKYYTAPQQLPGGAKTRYMRAVCRARTTNASNEQYFRMVIQNYFGKNINGTNWVTLGAQQLFATTTFRELANPIDTYTVTNGQKISGGVIDQNAINNLAVEIYNVEGINTIQVSKAWIEVYYDEKPTIVLSELGTVINTTSPVLTWLFTDDLETQAAVDVQILNNVGTVVHSVTKFLTSAGSYGIPVSLANGTYTARVRAHQAWKYTGDAPVSDWDEISFTIAVSVPATPTFALTEQADQARVRLIAEHNLNLLPEGVAEAEVAGWESISNANLYSGDVFISGDRSLIVEAIITADTTVRSIPAIPVTAGQVYGFGFKSRPYPGDTPVNVKACIRWLNAAGGTVSDVFSVNFLEIAGQWKDAFHTATAPVGAVYAKPFMIWYSATAGSWHYMDAPIFTPLNGIGAPLPAWSRGGFASPTINLLGFADSTLEGAAHWTPVEATTSATVVNIISETGDDYYQYQGNNALKVATTNILARRDNETAVIATGTSLVVNKGDVVEGDFMLATIAVNNTTSTITPPAGWTKYGNRDSTSVRTDIYYKIAGPAEAATYTFTLSGSSKAAAHITSYDGVVGIYAGNSVAVTTSTTVFNMPASVTQHNGQVVEIVAGVRAASASPTTWTSNMVGANYDAQISTTANTANEIAVGVYSKRYVTKVVTDTAVTGNTQTSNAALTAAATWTIVLQPARQTSRATLQSYEYYDYDTLLNYTASVAVLGANSSTINSANRNVAMIVDVYDNNKAFINGYLVAQGAATPGAWKRLTANFNLADNPLVKYATIRLEIDQITDAEAYYFDAIALYQSTTNLGYMEGYKSTDGPYMELQYSEDNGETWKSGEVKAIEDATLTQLTFYDYEIPSETERLYRFFNWRVEDNNLLQSGYSATQAAEIKLYRVWMHLITDPEGTIYHFIYDGTGRDSEFDKRANILTFAGREYGQAHFGETNEYIVNANLQLPTKESILALRKLNNTKALIIFRDGRGRRLKGLLEVKFTDVRWGNTVSFTVTALGDQPW